MSGESGDRERGTADPGTPASEPGSERPASPDDIFADFVRRANAEWVASIEAVLGELEAELEGSPLEGSALDAVTAVDPVTTVAPVARRDPPRDREGTDRVVLLTRPKARKPGRQDDVTVRRPALSARPAPDWSSVVPERSQTTQRREAAELVPDVASVPPPPIPAPEGSEDGLMPSGELDRKLADMDVLVRYGHVPQVQSELETLRLGYPDDLLLLRRISELYVRHRLRGPALEALFTLAGGLFERRNVEGMRQALEQVMVLDPGNRRAARLLALLDQRPAAPAAGRPPSRPRP